jgi:hypothetical protein
LFLVVAAVVHFRRPRAAPSQPDARDVALSLAAELEEGADRVGLAAQRGWWWLPSEAVPRSVWSAREAELRAFGEHFHKPVRDAYRKLAQHDRRAAQGEAAEYNAIGGELTQPGRQLTDEDRAALEETRGVIAHALERLSELGSLDGDQRLVTEEHRDGLRAALNRAQWAVERRSARDEEEPLVHEMFALHFPELERRLTDWDETAHRNVCAPVALKKALGDWLSKRALDQPPYTPVVIADAIGAIIGQRALAGKLGDPVPPAVGDAAVWRAWDNGRVGMADFNPATTAQNAVAIHMEGAEYPAEGFTARVEGLLAPLHELLAEAQDWAEAAEIRPAADALAAFPAGELIEDLKRAQVRPRMSIVDGCPGCG